MRRSVVLYSELSVAVSRPVSSHGIKLWVDGWARKCSANCSFFPLYFLMIDFYSRARYSSLLFYPENLIWVTNNDEEWWGEDENARLGSQFKRSCFA